MVTKKHIRLTGHATFFGSCQMKKETALAHLTLNPKGNSMHTFEKLESYIVELLDRFGEQQYEDSGFSMYSGGYTNADYEDMDEEDVFLKLELGIQNPPDDEHHVEHYRISIEDLLNSDLSWNEKLRRIK